MFFQQGNEITLVNLYRSVNADFCQLRSHVKSLYLQEVQLLEKLFGYFREDFL